MPTGVLRNDSFPRFASFFLLLHCLLCGQAPPSLLSIKGEVLEGRSPASAHLAVELYDISRHLVPSRAPLNRDGSFEFRNIEAGSYQVKVTNDRGGVVYQDFANIHPNSPQLVLRIPGSDGPARAAGTVSVQSLLRRPAPGKAQKEFRRSQEAFEKGDVAASVAHLERAIRIDPDFVEAHINLGARYNVRQEHEKAAAEFRKAIELEPDCAMAYYDLSLSLFLLRRYTEAETAARRAVELAPHYLRARYALGLILTTMGKNTPEALDNLRIAAKEFPNARLIAAQVEERQARIGE